MAQLVKVMGMLQDKLAQGREQHAISLAPEPCGYKNIIVLITVCVGSVAHIAVEAYLRATADSFFEKYSLSSIERISKAEDIYFKMWKT